MFSESFVDIDVDGIIEKLLAFPKNKFAKEVDLSEGEITGLCLQAREIFLGQPSLLELDPPLKICGNQPSQISLS